jgi:hypothetical protein
MKTLYPRSGANLVVWTSNFSSQLKTAGPALGLTAAEVTDIQKQCQELVESINLADQKKKDWRGAGKAAEAQRKATLGPVSKTIARLKTSPGWTGAFAQTLGVQTTTRQTPPLDTHKPVLRAQKTAGRIELRFTRKQLDGVNIYTRKKGEATWRFFDRVRYSPAVDATPVTTPGIPEVREYRLIAISKDQEVGQPSDIVSMTIGD